MVLTVLKTVETVGGFKFYILIPQDKSRAEYYPLLFSKFIILYSDISRMKMNHTIMHLYNHAIILT